MPRLTPDTTRAARTVTLWALRLVGLWLITWGLFQIGTRLTFGISGSIFNNGSLRDAARTWTGIGETHGLFRGLPTLLLGIALALASKHLARWIIRPPSHTCLRCDHPLSEGDHPVPTRCPECGEPTA